LQAARWSSGLPGTARENSDCGARVLGAHSEEERERESEMLGFSDGGSWYL
jgi:hypothetical protein